MSNRKKMLQDLPMIMDWAKKQGKDRALGQQDVFSFIYGEDSDFQESSPEPSGPDTDDFSYMEKLRLEKEYLGVYLSGHPLLRLYRSAKILGLRLIEDLPNAEDGSVVELLAIVTSKREFLTKKSQELMAIVQLESVRGAIEAVVFSRTYANFREQLQENAILVFTGKIDQRDDAPQLILEGVRAIEQYSMLIAGIPIGKIPYEYAIAGIQRALMPLKSRDGKGVPLVLRISDGERVEYVSTPIKIRDPEIGCASIAAVGLESLLISLADPDIGSIV